MKTMTYVITDDLGIHARPAGQLVKVVSGFGSNVQIGIPDKMVDAKRIMGVMGLAAKQGTEITLTFDGPDEDAAMAATKEFLKANL